MAFNGEFITYLKATASLDSAFGDRFYWNEAPPSANQAIASSGCYAVFNEITADRPKHLLATSGVIRSRIQCSVYAMTHAGAETGFEALRTVTDGYRGTMSGVTVERIWLVDSGDIYVAAQRGENVGLHGIRLDYLVLWRESVPTFS